MANSEANANMPLSEAEFQSLAQLAEGADAAQIPAEHRGLLIRLGLLKRSGRDLRVTAAGRLRAMEGR